MPDWPEPCPLHVHVEARNGSGATGFTFGPVISQEMTVRGRLNEILADVLPHEVTHTVLAHALHRAVPRWADEGGASLSESDRMMDVLQHAVLDDYSAGRLYQLRNVFTFRDYPAQVGTFYAESAWVSGYLIEKKGRPEFLAFVRDGIQQGWDAALTAHYSYRSVEALQQDWVANCILKNRPIRTRIKQLLDGAKPKPIQPPPDQPPPDQGTTPPAPGLPVPASPVPAMPDPAVQARLKQLEQQLADLVKQKAPDLEPLVAPLRADLKRVLDLSDGNAGQLAGLAGKLKAAETAIAGNGVDLNGLTAKLKAAEADLAAHGADLSKLKPLAPLIEQALPVVQKALPVAGQLVDVAGWAKYLPLLATGAATGPAGLLLVLVPLLLKLGGGAASASARRVRAPALGTGASPPADSPLAPPPAVVVTQRPPPQQVVREGQTFVPYEADNREATAYRQAVALAKEQKISGPDVPNWIEQVKHQILAGLSAQPGPQKG